MLFIQRYRSHVFFRMVMEGIGCHKILDSRQFVRDAAVVPPNMRKSVFTTADVDDINEIVRSTLQQNDLMVLSFHLRTISRQTMNG